MNFGHWLKSLSGLDHLILLGLYIICIFLSKKSLETIIEYYDEKKNYSEFRVRLRITPSILLSLAFLYSFTIYHVLDAIFHFMP